VTVLGSKDEKWKRPVKVLTIPYGAYPVCVAVGQEILSVRVPSICEFLQQRRCLLDEFVALVYQRVVRDWLRVIGRITWRRGRRGVVHRFRSVNHEHCKLKDELWVVCLFRVRSVEVESFIMRK
jgi:hypothetical protein